MDVLLGLPPTQTDNLSKSYAVQVIGVNEQHTLAKRLLIIENLSSEHQHLNA